MIRAEGLTRTAGATRILDGVDLEVAAGSFTALLGASGSGKSTLLRIIAGLDQPDSGTLFLAGKPALGLRPGERGVGFVFQSYALFEHMSVGANISFGLDVRRPRLHRAAIAAKVEEMLALVRLTGLADRLPSQLSGGQRQRVALARTLAVQPRILLLDEPFGALDRQVRDELRTELRRIHDALGTTTLFVTHDEHEAAALADRTVVLERGRIVGTAPLVRAPAQTAIAAASHSPVSPGSLTADAFEA
jgi:sulfate transport system ATP-binding protein